MPMIDKFVWVILPRWMAIAPVLFSLVGVLLIAYTFQSGRPTVYRTAMRWFTLVCCGASILSCFIIADRIIQGRPFRTSSEKLISWGTVVPRPDVSSATPDRKTRL
jgi:hypothetical protein